MRRPIGGAVAAGFTLLLTACASGEGTSSTWGEYFEVVKQSFSGTFGGGVITRDKAAAIPYASLGYRLNGGPQSLVVLATENNGEELWTSNARIVLVTQNGLVKRTVGLPRDIGGLAPATGANLPSAATALAGPFTVTLTADFPGIGIYSVPLSCRFAAIDAETITILGQAITTTRVDENCDSSQLGWRFRNSYWLDSNKFVWRTIQHIHPKGDMLEIEVFRPPS